MLLKAGANVNVADLWQYTPLHEAASKARAEVCSLLLVHGADPNQTNCHGKTAVDLAQSLELKERLVLEHKGLSLLEAARLADSSKVSVVRGWLADLREADFWGTALSCPC